MERLARTVSLGSPANHVVYKPIAKEIQEKAKESVSKLAKEMIKKGNYNENRLVEKAFEHVSGTSIEELKKLSVEELDLDHKLNDGWQAVHEALDNLKGGTIYGPETPILSEHFRHGEQDGKRYLTRIADWTKKHPKATVAILGGIVMGAAATAIAANYFLNNGMKNSQNQGKTTDSDRDGLTDSDGDGIPDSKEVEMGLNPNSTDTDGDYVSDGIEVKEGSDPKKIDSDGGGIDDFNEKYTYQSNPSDPSDDKAIIKNIPNNKVRHWNPDDGDTISSFKKYIEISKRDPLVQHFAKKSEIIWPKPSEGIIGKLYVDGKLIWNSKGEPNERSLDQPSYYLTHDRYGDCVDSSVVNAVILDLMGHKAKIIEGNRPEGGHSWVETLINENVFVVNFNEISPREGFYERENMVPGTNYNLNWYLE